MARRSWLRRLLVQVPSPESRAPQGAPSRPAPQAERPLEDEPTVDDHQRSGRRRDDPGDCRETRRLFEQLASELQQHDAGHQSSPVRSSKPSAMLKF